MSTNTTRSGRRLHALADGCSWFVTIVGWRQIGLLLLLSLSACGGGMVGTGNGPDEPVVYQPRLLPERIGTDLPAPLIDPQIFAAMFEGTSFVDRDDIDTTSELWRTLVEQLGEIESLRLKAEESLILIDAVLPALQSQCDDDGEVICRLPANSIDGLYTEDLVAGIDAVYTRALGTVGDTTQVLIGVREELQSRLGDTYRLGDVELLPGDGQPYDIDIATSLRDVLGNSRLRIRSNLSRTHSELTVTSQVGDISDRQQIGFAKGLPGERFTYTRDRMLGSTIEYRFDVSIVADTSPERRVLLDARYRARVGAIDRDIAFSGQVDNQQGVAKSRQYQTLDDLIRNIRFTEESFAADGTLQAGQTCNGRVDLQTCNEASDFTLYGDSGGQVTDSTLYFTTSEFDQLIAMSDTMRFEIVGLPADVIDFRVLTDDDALALIDRDVLCSGVQLAANDVLLYCTAPADRLSTSVVVAVDRDTGAITQQLQAGLVVR